MSMEIVLTLGILLLAVVFFVTEILRADLVALFVLVILVIVGLVTPEESISGFANPAVVTIWAVFILSAGLERSGVAAMLGEKVLQMAGSGEKRLLAVLMSSTAVLSGIINNIGVAAMFLPVTQDIARRTGRAASRLLLPMAYGSLFGGMLILIGTSSNLVVSDFLREAGMRPLGLFDFTPIGVVILLVSIGYMLTIGHRLLPQRKAPTAFSTDHMDADSDFRKHYELDERLAMIEIPENSTLVGKTLAESRFGLALGLNVLNVTRGSGDTHVPDPDLELHAGDRLLILGRLDVIDELSGSPIIVLDESAPNASCLISNDVGLVELEITEQSMFNGKTVVGIDARKSLGVSVLAVIRNEVKRRTNLRDIVFEPGDRVLLQGPVERLDILESHAGFRRLRAEDTEEYELDERLLFVRIPAGSPLAGKSYKEMNFATGYGISVHAIMRDATAILMPESSEKLEENDVLLVGGRPIDLEVLRGHQTLIIDRDPQVDLGELETGGLSIVEVLLSPYSTLAGKTLRQLGFREKYGVSVLAIWRGNRSFRTRVGDVALEYGDAILCYGAREKFELLARERDFVVLMLDVQEKPLVKKAPISALIMLFVVVAVLLGWLPIYVSAIAGASLMVLTGCLTIEQAYASIEWKAVFLIAAMLPMGLAMQQTGAAALIADAVVQLVGPYGPTAILAGIMTLTLLINQFIPSAVNAVVMTPIAIAAAVGMGVSPYPLVMSIAYAAAASFMTPVSHPANVLVMTPGGYRFSDYVKNGLPLSVIVLIISVLLIPVVFPF